MVCGKLIGRRKRAFGPLAPMLGDDGKPLRAKANQHQRDLVEELGENCVEISEAENLAEAQADKQAAPVELIGQQPGTSALPGTELARSPSPSRIVLAGLTPSPRS